VKFCNYHRDREVAHYCAGCGIGLCNECSQAIRFNKYYCYSCFLFVDDESTVKPQPSFYYFLFMFAVVIVVMIIIILSPSSTV
jgi:hypothetical protein